MNGNVDSNATHSFSSSLKHKTRFINLIMMTIFASGPEREIQRFDWFLSGVELAVPAR